MELTKQELKVLNLIGQFPTWNKDKIADQLNTSKNTVGTKINKLRKYGLVVKAVPELQDKNFNWLVTGKFKSKLRKLLLKIYVEYALPIPKQVIKYYYYQPKHVNPNMVSVYKIDLKLLGGEDG